MEDKSNHVDNKRMSIMQQVVICVLYYLCEVDCIVVIDLGSIVSE